MPTTRGGRKTTQPTTSAQKVNAVTEAAKRSQRKTKSRGPTRSANSQSTPEPPTETPPPGSELPPSPLSERLGQRLVQRPASPETHGSHDVIPPTIETQQPVISSQAMPTVQIEALLEQLAVEKAARQKAEDQAMRLRQIASHREVQRQATSVSGRENTLDGNLPLIPKPVGKIHIQRDMGLENDDATYNEIQKYVTEQFCRVSIDLTLSWKNQPMDAKGKVAQLARHHYPILARCSGDWATMALMQQYLGNRRKYRRKKEKTQLAKSRSAVAINDGDTNTRNIGNEDSGDNEDHFSDFEGV